MYFMIFSLRLQDHVIIIISLETSKFYSRVNIFLSLPFSIYYRAAAAKSLQSRLTLCDPIDDSLPGFPVPGILQARTLEWVAISFSNA